MTAAAGDAHPFPIYDARYRLVFPIFDNTGALVAGAAGHNHVELTCQH